MVIILDNDRHRLTKFVRGAFVMQRQPPSLIIMKHIHRWLHGGAARLKGKGQPIKC